VEVRSSKIEIEMRASRVEMRPIYTVTMEHSDYGHDHFLLPYHAHTQWPRHSLVDGVVSIRRGTSSCRRYRASYCHWITRLHSESQSFHVSEIRSRAILSVLILRGPTLMQRIVIIVGLLSKEDLMRGHMTREEP